MHSNNFYLSIMSSSYREESLRCKNVRRGVVDVKAVSHSSTERRKDWVVVYFCWFRPGGISKFKVWDYYATEDLARNIVERAHRPGSGSSCGRQYYCHVSVYEKMKALYL